MQTLTTSLDSTTAAHQNLQPKQEIASNLSFNTNLDSGTIAILEQIEAECKLPTTVSERVQWGL